MKGLINALKMFGAALLIVGAVLVAVLVFFLGTRSYHTQSHTTYNFFTAVSLLLQRAWVLAFSPANLSRDEVDILSNFGNALILAISLLAIGVSSVSVMAKLNSISAILPYEKYDINWMRRSGFWLVALSRHLPHAHKFIEGRKAAAYRNLSVKKMVHFYKRADRLLVISGDYSWLFNSKWSRQARAEIACRIPHDVCLISFRDPSEVANYWKQQAGYRELKQIFSALAFVRTSNEYNGSIVKCGRDSLYIYLFRPSLRSGQHTSVCAFHAVHEATTLVGIVEDDLRRLYNDGHGDPALEREKNLILDDPNYFG